MRERSSQRLKHLYTDSHLNFLFDLMKMIEQHINELRRLCDKYYVSQLYVFGSVAKDESADKSDIDF